MLQLANELASCCMMLSISRHTSERIKTPSTLNSMPCKTGEFIAEVPYGLDLGNAIFTKIIAECLKTNFVQHHGKFLQGVSNESVLLNFFMSIL